MNSMPPPMTGPGPSIDPPRPVTPFTVVYSRMLSKSQSTLPLAVAYARMCPSTEPEKATPGTAVTAADCAGLHRGRDPHGEGAAVQIRPPSDNRNANIPPPSFGSASVVVL